MQTLIDQKTEEAMRLIDKPKLRRALAILTTEVDESHIAFKGYNVIVRGESFCTLDPEDCAVLAILMADKEFGFAVSGIEIMAKELRALQQVWCDASNEMGLREARKAEFERAVAA